MEGNDPRNGNKTIKSVRPWGEIYMLVRNFPCSVDLTEALPGKRSSLHSHKQRYELFHFLDGNARLELDGKVYSPGAHEEFLIRPGVKHRFWAENNTFRMLVISFGEWKAEDQFRHADDYGREGERVKL